MELMIVTDPRVAKRFWSKVRPAAADECWIWMAAKSGGGYGQVSIGGKNRYAHRVAYGAMRAEIPAGLQLDHLCRVRECVNPYHLEPVTNRENGIRGGVVRRMEVCLRGHEMTPENSHMKATGRAVCYACERRKVPCPRCGKLLNARHIKRHLAETARCKRMDAMWGDV